MVKCTVRDRVARKQLVNPPEDIGSSPIYKTVLTKINHRVLISVVTKIALDKVTFRNIRTSACLTIGERSPLLF